MHFTYHPQKLIFKPDLLTKFNFGNANFRNKIDQIGSLFTLNQRRILFPTFLLYVKMIFVFYKILICLKFVLNLKVSPIGIEFD